MITHHSNKWQGYGRTAQDLVSLKQYKEAQTKINRGLNKLPNQLNLLTIANDMYRASGEREKALGYARLLITHHPDKWQGYGRAAKDLIALKHLKEAQESIDRGLRKFQTI